MDLLKQNEIRVNRILLITMSSFYIAGQLLHAILLFLGMSDSTNLEIFYGYVAGVPSLIICYVLWRLYPERGFIKYALTVCGIIVVGIIIFVNEKGMIYNSLWFYLIILCSLYFNLKLVIFVGSIAFILQCYFVYKVPGPDLENLRFTDYIGSALTFAVATITLFFIVFLGRKFIDQIVSSEEESTRARKQVEDLLSKTHQAASKVSDVSSTLSDSAMNLSCSVQEVASTANQFAVSVNEMANRYDDLSNTSGKVSVKAAKGNEEIEGAMAQIEAITSVIERVRVSVEKLVMKTREISGKITTIDEISSQTNLLALNAAIEAARAGRHGAGFGVVADEVRKLSVQVTTSAQEISIMLEENEEEATNTAAEIKDGVEQVNRSTEVFRNTGTSFREIIKAVESVTKYINEIAEMGRDLEGGSDNLASVTEEQSGAVSELNEMAVKLNETSKGLFEELDKKLD